ncbi:hypothetical protein JW851_04765 [Candidatus Woesearchaeota archaeon]|nr:hypothetical protein [Candidatus Woesearchaeota archaeon]
MLELKHSSNIYVPLDNIEAAKYVFFEELLAEAKKHPDIEITEFDVSKGFSERYSFFIREGSNPIYFKRQIKFRKFPVFHAGRRIDNSFEVGLEGTIGDFKVISTPSIEREIFGPQDWGWIEDPFDLEDNPCNSSAIKAYFDQKLDGDRLNKFNLILRRIKSCLN